MTDERFSLIIRAVVTLALLGFAYVMRAVQDATGTSNIIIGAAVSHWLGGSAQFAKATVDRARKKTTRKRT